ncbi:MAG: protease complex subunit PrcB family protein, partial [Firmicutes bacterium]|nr:protease complex subunit PrcB family protein [Bacillota bacterium]
AILILALALTAGCTPTGGVAGSPSSGQTVPPQASAPPRETPWPVGTPPAQAGAGSQSGHPTTPTAPASSGPSSGAAAEKVLTGFDKLSDRAAAVQWIDSLKKVEGVYVNQIGNLRVYLVAMGEKPTGGYQVKIDQIGTSKGSWLVDVVYVRPAPGQMVSQVVTYPYEVVAVPIGPGERPVRFRLIEGAKITELPLTQAPQGKGNVQVTSPKPQAVIKSPVTITGKTRVFEGVLRVQVEDGHDVLAEATIQAARGTGEWGDFRITLPFKHTPTNDYGAIVFSTNSPRDGSRVEELLVPVRFK